MVNALTWRKVLAVLHADLKNPIEKLKRNFSQGIKYFEQILDVEKQGSDIKKYRLKKRRISRTKSTIKY